MTVAGIDPGNKDSAIIVWDGSKILYRDQLDNKTMRQMIKAEIRTFNPSLVAIEKIQCMGIRVGSEVMDTATEVGRFAQIVDDLNLDYVLVKRTDIKKHHCGKATKVKDPHLRQSLINRFGEPGTKKNPGILYGIAGYDQWSALAIAVFAFDKYKI